MVEGSFSIVASMLTASRQAQQAGHFDEMLEHAERADKAASGDLSTKFRLLECLLYCGWPNRVLNELAKLEAGADPNHRLLCQLAEYYSHCGDHASGFCGPPRPVPAARPSDR